jgi:hypothetical protein
MKTLRLWLAAILFVFNLSASGQHRYVEKMLNTENPDSKDFLMVDKIGQIILSGYLDGKIKAYRFMVKDSVLKWSEPEVMPPAWSPADYYNMGDRVMFGNKAYEAQIEMSNGYEPRDAPNDFWARVDLREPLLTRRFYPIEKDTLSKSEFLSRMVSQQPVFYPNWEPKVEYYNMDLASYNGTVYESLRDYNKGNVPKDNYDYWALTDQGSMQFYRLRDAKTVSVLFNYSIVQTDTIWNPQMVAVNVWDDNYDMYKQLTYFKYDDVMRYLEKVPQPVINNLAANRLSNTLLIQNQLQRPEYLKWFKKKFKTKPITTEPKWISDPKLFQMWLASSDSTGNSDYDKWRFFQDLNSRNLVLVRVEYKNDGLQGQPFLTIPVKSLEKLYQDLKIKAPVLKNYSDALQDMTYLTAPVESHYLDSIQPLQSRFKNKVQSVKEYYFIEKYTANISEDRNPVIAKMLPQAWPIIEKQFYAKILKEEIAHASFYEDNFDWRKVSPWNQFGTAYYFDENFGLDDYWYYFGRDSIPTPLEFTQLFVTYKKYFSTGKSAGAQFEPIYVSIGFRENNSSQTGLQNQVWFKWSALKEQLLKSAITFSPLIKAIETGKLEFYDSELVYGLREK